MGKTILITGSTAGIGLLTAERLVAKGHRVLVHGRSAAKVAEVEARLSALGGAGAVEGYVADLSRFPEVEQLAQVVAARHVVVDVLINNAGVFRTRTPRTAEGLDVRFAVNAIAPYLLTRGLLSRIPVSGRVVNLSSAAQSPVDLEILAGKGSLSDGAAYAQSKLALTAWSGWLAASLGERGPLIVAVNPGSMLGTKMVKEAYGVSGKDVGIGAEVLVQAALSDRFAGASGRYFDNDSGQFAAPHPDAMDPGKREAVVRAIEMVLGR